MKIEEFFEQFSELGLQVSKLEEELKNKRKEIGPLEDDLGKRKSMQQVLDGLKTTPKQEDPGKYGPAFYFVAELTDNDIKRADEPSLCMPCPQCKTVHPVLMKYEQTFDSLEGDTWEKEAFIMCEEYGVCQVAHHISDYRF